LKNGDLVRGFTQLENGETMENNGSAYPLVNIQKTMEKDPPCYLAG
jgi:hypothetical protein